MEVSVENISRSYGLQKAVDSVSFKVNTGEIVGFLGPNGAGKTTTMKIITCFMSPDEGDVKIGELSKGYQQRVGLAQALIHNPEVLILDEPTSGLDPNQIVEIRELIKKIGKEKTVIFCSHILAEVEATCDRIIIINSGKLVADGTSNDLRKQAQKKEILKVTIEDGDKNEVFMALQKLDTIEMVDPLPSYTNSYEIMSRAYTTSRRSIFKLCVERGWALTEMTPIERKLEEVFRELTIKN